MAHVHVAVDFLFFTIGGDVDITLGYLQLPPPVVHGQRLRTQPTGVRPHAHLERDATDPTVLYLNVGAARGAHATSASDDANESMIIEQVGGTGRRRHDQGHARSAAATPTSTSANRGRFGGGNDTVVIKQGVLRARSSSTAAPATTSITNEGSTTCDPSRCRRVANRCNAFYGGAATTSCTPWARHPQRRRRRRHADATPAPARRQLNGGGGNDKLLRLGSTGRRAQRRRRQRRADRARRSPTTAATATTPSGLDLDRRSGRGHADRRRRRDRPPGRHLRRPPRRRSTSRRTDADHGRHALRHRAGSATTSPQALTGIENLDLDARRRRRRPRGPRPRRAPRSAR